MAESPPPRRAPESTIAAGAQASSADAPTAATAVPPSASTPRRAVFLVGGGLGLVVLTLVSYGAALAALAGMGVAALLQRRRGRRYTLLAGWTGAVSGVAVVALIASAALVVKAPRASFTRAFDSVASRAGTRPPHHLPGILQRMQPPAQNDSAMQASIRSMTRSHAFLWFSMVFGLMAIVGLLAALIGTPTWGLVTLIGFGLHGRWPPGSGG